MCKEGPLPLQIQEALLKFLQKRKIKLTPWQLAAARLFYSAPLGAGKSYLLRVLQDFEDSLNV